MLDVQIFPVPVGQVQQGAGVGAVLAAAVDLQLHAKVAGALSVEQGLGLVVVVPDGDLPAAVEAIRAIGGLVVLVPVLIAGLGCAEQGAAAAAVGVVVVKAALTQGHRFAARVVVGPDALPAGAAEDRPLVEAGLTQLQAVKGVEFLRRMAGVAQAAGSQFFHRYYLHSFVTPMASGSFIEIISNPNEVNLRFGKAKSTNIPVNP